jgi:metal-sulfur cluster biosynthetic enzyme
MRRDDMSEQQPTPECLDEVERIIRTLSNQVFDPCALGAGLRIGMAEMGLIKRVEGERNEEGRWGVKVVMRFTGPDCMNYFYFKQNLERLMSEIPWVASALLDFSEEFDWSHDLMSDDARDRFYASTRSGRPQSERGGRAFPIT